jgi:hypothetical protein
MKNCVCGARYSDDMSRCPRCRCAAGSAEQQGTTDSCPECGAVAVIPQDGCWVCTVCGWSACG